MHAIKTETQSVRFLTEQIANLAGDVKRLAEKVEQNSRQAVPRPSQSGLALLGQYVGLAVAVVALIIATRA